MRKNMPASYCVAVMLIIVAAASICWSQSAVVPVKTFEGQMVRVDSAQHTVTIKGMEDKEIKEMTFKYSDTTEVAGGDRTVQGLSGKSGASLKITYRFDRGLNEATRIEWLEKP
jgi:hypothetical protein